MRKLIIILMALCCIQLVWAQPATKSYPFSVGRAGCSNGAQQMQFYNYDAATNVIQNATGGLVNPCVPQFRIGTSGGGSGSQRFTSNISSVSFNPVDKNIYYLWTNLTAPVRTYAWRYPLGTCPTATNPRLDTIRSFAADILGVAFDNNGNGYLLEFTNEPNGVPHKMMIRSIDFATGVMGGADTMNITGGATIWVTGSGDLAMSPSGQMYFVVNNKMFTPNYTAYTGTGSFITCTYLDTIPNPNYFVGLTYADGETIAAYSGGGCPYVEIDPLTRITAAITKNNIPTTVTSTHDFASVISGAGAAKRLVSVTPTGIPNQYNVVYDILIKNYGNMNVSNLQVTDDLGAINGNANVSNVSVSIPVNPNGYIVNPVYTGEGPLAINYNLLNAPVILPNFPVANSSFTIRISCRLSNIQAGIVYNNSAVVTARDFNNNDLRDFSTDGNDPDRNSNDKPDDVGENQPTPLLVTVPAITPPCVSLTNVLYSQNFASGTGLVAAIPPAVLGPGVFLGTASSLYVSATTQPLPVERYTLTNNANNAYTANFINLTDHTGNPNGRMLIINADAANTIMYRGSFFTSTCSNTQYSLSFYAAFPGNGAYQTICDAFGGFRYPKIKMRIRDGISGLIITETSTTDITNSTWQQYGLKFVAPASYNQLFIELINDAPGGCGNDILLDDIQFGTCDPTPTVSSTVVSGCLGGPGTFISNISDPGAISGTVEYQWQVASLLSGPWANIIGANTANYTIPAVVAADTGRYYRVLISAAGNILNPSCRFASPGLILQGKLLSVAATGATINKNNLCPLIPVTLGITGGSLGDAAQWVWYEGSCSGTPINTGATINFAAPNATTTYFVRAQGTCNITPCRTVTLFISCNIDKDRDGIPDYVESYMPLALTDHNSNGISNAFDPAYPGFVDNNNDYINDNFQADGDSDNDGIPNYLDTTFPGRVDSNGDSVDDRFDMDRDGIINMLDLDSDNDGIPDVVEAGGVDTNGDGQIDNFTDTDNDGLSQNVDGNNTGARISGIGLGVMDLDGDGRPNAIDRDSDGDGIPDVVEVGGPDTNNNAIIDGFTDLNGDGIADAYINASGLLRTGPDTNNDGRPNSYPNKNFDNDGRANPYDLDSDMDGIVDVVEAGFNDTDYNGFADGASGSDGWNNTIRALGSLNLLNSDGVGNPNYLDIDSDGDGIPDNVEGQTTIGYRFPTYLDTDNDGIDNAYDGAPFAASFGGSGIFLADKDADSIPDYIDLDTDSDGVLDIVEGNDFNLNGMSDDNVTPTGLDTDADGLDNRFDSLNSVTNRRGTSYMMGTGGSLIGDPAPGTRSPVQRTIISQPERDWRYVTYVLPLQYFEFSGSENKNNVTLNWAVLSNINLDLFEIERSTDNQRFERASSQPAAVTLGELKNFTGFDFIGDISGDKVFYRLKVIAQNGQIRYSNVILIRKTSNNIPVTIQPNPASDYTVIQFMTQKAGVMLISIKDNLGRTVHSIKINVQKGSNSISMNGLSKFSSAVYHVVMQLDDEIISKKLIIQH